MGDCKSLVPIAALPQRPVRPCPLDHKNSLKSLQQSKKSIKKIQKTAKNFKKNLPKTIKVIAKMYFFST
jgi:hypothetical protein